jgi:hypothetical protein
MPWVQGFGRWNAHFTNQSQAAATRAAVSAWSSQVRSRPVQVAVRAVIAGTADAAAMLDAAAALGRAHRSATLAVPMFGPRWLSMAARAITSPIA